MVYIYDICKLLSSLGKQKKYLIVLVVLFVAGMGFLALRNGSSSVQPAQDASVVEGEENTIVYSDTGFSPENLTVHPRDTVKFIKQADKPMWVASDPHPVHTNYSAFDQLSDGDEYTFTFTEAGSYPYHNHLTPTDTGVVVVE